MIIKSGFACLTTSMIFSLDSRSNSTSPSEIPPQIDSAPIIFALANPEPEIYPSEAKKAGASVVGTGRSDFSNQINNALVFPGIFMGLLQSRVKKVTMGMKIAAATSLAYTVKKPNKNNILPKITSKNAVQAIAKAIIAKKD